MAELTVEQKAERYDESVRMAKSRIKNDKDHVLYEDDIIEIFPELKESVTESADEKVRKALIKLVSNHASMDLFIDYDIHLDEALSWLEKQGEKEKFIKKELGCIHGYREEAIRRLQELEKQGKQKTDWSEADENVADHILSQLRSDNFSGVLGKTLLKEAESWLESLKDRINIKQEWSTDDVKMLDTIIEDIVKLAGPRVCYHKDVDWLKSLKDRALPVPAELSETNEAILDALLRRLEGEDIHVFKHLAVDCLKAILRQKQSKPSAKHYELEEFAKIVRGNLTGISKAVQELFEAKYLQLTGSKMFGGFND